MTDTTCQWLDDDLDDYLDDGLSEGDRERYERHIAACAKCRDALRRQRELDGAVRAYAATLEPKRPVRAPLAASELSGRKPAWRRNSTAAAIRLAAVASSAIAVAMLSMFSTEREAERAADGTLERGRSVKAPDGGAGEPLQTAANGAGASATGANAAKEADLAPQVLAIDAPDFLAIVEPPRGDELTFVMLYPTSKSLKSSKSSK